jgi:hypothetical protein
MRRMITTNKARSDRWRREDEAPRLKEKVSGITALRFELEEFSEDHAIVGTRRVRHIVVDQAAALFEIPCSDAKCEDGGHDFTRDVLEQLTRRAKLFEAQSTCSGYVQSRACGRILKLVARAEYDDPPAKE